MMVFSACGSDGEDRGTRTLRSRTYAYSLRYPRTRSVIQADRELESGQPPLTGRPVTDILGRNANRSVSKMTLPAHMWTAVIHGGRGFHIVWFDTTGHRARDARQFERCFPLSASRIDGERRRRKWSRGPFSVAH
jgi:hypothetical protein